MKKLLKVLLLLLVIQSCNKQDSPQKRMGGWVKDKDEAARLEPQLILLDLPAVFNLPTPPPQDQGSEGSCVAFAVSYAKDIDYYIRKNHTSFATNLNIFSTEYLYNQAKFWDCYGGTAMQPCLDTLVNQGSSLWVTMPSVAGCDVIPNETQRAEAINYRITGYTKTSVTDRAAIKSLIVTGHPVIFGYNPDNNFINAPSSPDYIWTYPRVAGTLPHCSVIVGYDDSKNAYKILNSWGTSWANGGFAYIDYDFFEDRGYEAGNPSVGGAYAGTWVYSINGINDYTPPPVIINPPPPPPPPVVITEQVQITVVKTNVKGTVTDIISWNITTNNPPLSAQIELFNNPIYQITIPVGTYRNVGVNKRVYRTYRIKVVKSDGTIMYSQTVNIK